MSTEEFVGFFFMPNQLLYYSILFFSLLIYYLVYRKYYLSIIDPSFLEVISSMFGFSVVLFLCFTDNISSRYIYSYFISQLFFWIGFIMANRKKIFVSDSFLRVKDEINMLKCIFFVSLVLYVSTTLLSYWMLGIPIFAASRLDINANAQGGMGILSRFASLNIICLYCTFYYYSSHSKDRIIRVMQFVSVLFFVIFSILSGSKSSFLRVAIVYFCFVIVNRSYGKKMYDNLKKKQYYFILLGVIAALSVIIISTGESLGNSILSLAFRFVGSGDVYWLGYPNDMLEDVPFYNPFIVLFQSILGFFRMVPHSEFPEPIGYTLSSFFYDKTSLTGANARHNIFGYAYFGLYGGIIFSFCIGWIVGSVRNLFLNAEKQGNICKIIIILLYINVFSLEGDPTLYTSYLTDLFVSLFITLILSLILYLNNVSNRNFVGNI